MSNSWKSALPPPSFSIYLFLSLTHTHLQHLISSYVISLDSIIIISLIRRGLRNRWPKNSRRKLLNRANVGIAGLDRKDFVQQGVMASTREESAHTPFYDTNQHA